MGDGVWVTYLGNGVEVKWRDCLSGKGGGMELVMGLCCVYLQHIGWLLTLLCFTLRCCVCMSYERNHKTGTIVLT